MDANATGLSDEQMAAESVTALPDKEVVSILDLNADLDLAIDAAAPIDLAVAANANVAAPIDAAVGANVLSDDSTAQALTDQGVQIDQNIVGDASATSEQVSDLDQSNDVVDAGSTGAADSGSADGGAVGASGGVDSTTGSTLGAVGDTFDGVTDSGAVGDTLDGTTGTVGDTVDGVTDSGAVGDTLDGTTGTVGDTLDGATGTLDGAAAGASTSDMLSGDILDVDVNLAADADLAAPIAGSVAANANVAAPIDAAVAANIGSDGSEATAVSQQDAIITQNIEGDATAGTDQESDITQ